MAVAALCFAFRFIVAYERPLQPSREDTAIYVGLIEDDRRELDRLGSKDFDPVKNRTITPAFVIAASGWKPLRQLNRKIKWTVSFDGKSLGEVESEPALSPQGAPEKITGPLNMHSILTPADKIPSVGRPEGKFNGNFETIVRRPLVVVSKPNYADPDGWKRTKAPDEVVEQVRLSFRKTFIHVRQCDTSGEPLKVDWDFPDSEIVTTKAYGSKKGSFVVKTELRHNRCVFNWDGSGLQFLGGDQWFYVALDRQVMHLGDSWELVDAGDYDGDGKSEVIFYVAEGRERSVDTEGYVLFYDDFHHYVRFTWKDR